MIEETFDGLTGGVVQVNSCAHWGSHGHVVELTFAKGKYHRHLVLAPDEARRMAVALIFAADVAEREAVA